MMKLSGPVSRRGAAVSEAAIESFAAGFQGALIRPGDPGYDAARRIWNASIDRYPGLIARCTGAADVVHAVRFAREHDLLVAVRGGGHNVGGRALCDSGLVIDLSPMKGVIVDAERRTVQVQAGATLGEVDRETHLFGLAVPFGVVSRTGVAGLTLGGGVGWLVRKYGLTCDNVLAFSVVTADGRTVTASPEGDADLFWALRGGGGNFGIVTSFLYRAHPVSTVLGGLLIYPRAEAAAVIRHYRGVMESAPEELTAYAGLICTPDGAPAVAMIACHCGELAQAECDIARLRSFGPPLADAIQRMPHPAMQRLLDGAFPDGTYNYWKSSFVSGLSDELIDRLVAHANIAGSPLSGIVVELYSGAASRVDSAATAFAQRHAQYDVGVMAQWTDPAERDRHVAWARAGAALLEPFSSGGYLLNFLAEEGEETIRGAFGANYPRLAELKLRYDPTNFFSLNQNVRPAA